MFEHEPQPPLEAHVDIGILTVIPAELDAARKALAPLTREKDQKTGTVFWRGTIRSELNKCDYRVVLSCIGEPGNPSAAAATTELLTKYDPSAVFLMGIAAGMRGKVKIGDVVLSDRVVAYEPAAWTKTKDGEEETQHRPEADRVPHTMMQDLVSYRPDAKRLEQIFKETEGKLPVPPPGKEEEYSKSVTATLTAKQATIGSGEKLLRNDDKIKALRRDIHGKLEVFEMEASGFQHAARRSSVPWLVVRGISDFGDEFKDDQFHAFASTTAAVVLIDFIAQGLDIGPPRPPPGWRAAEQATKEWQDETRDVIGQHDVRVPRDQLKQSILASVRDERVTVLLGDSGSGKSAILKALLQSGALPKVTLCLHAQDAVALVSSYDLHMVLRGQQKGNPRLFVLDGVDQVATTEDMRLVSRALRALAVDSAESDWRLVLTCQSESWEHTKETLMAQGVPLASARCVAVDRLKKAEVDQVAKDVQVLAPVLLRDELRPIMGRPKVLDLVAIAAAAVGLPDVTQWVGESSIIQWVWDRFIKGDGRGEQHSRLLMDVARRLADERLFSLSLTDLSTSDVGLLPALARLGILVVRNDTVRFAHELYADYARQRYLLALVISRPLGELKAKVANPLWHRAIRLVSLHLLEHDDSKGLADVETWRKLVRALDERSQAAEPESDDGERTEQARPGAGVDLLLEGIAFAAQPGHLLDTIGQDLAESGGSLLKSFLFRFRHATVQWVVLGDLFKLAAPEDISPERQKARAQRIPLPDYPVWDPVIDWISTHATQVLSCAPNEFVEIAEFWLMMTRVLLSDKLFHLASAQLLAQMVLNLSERALATQHHDWDHGRFAENRVRLYRVMLLCGGHLTDRVRALVQRLAGISGSSQIKKRAVSRSQVQPPIHPLSVDKPPFWPGGPKSEPSGQFRRAALTAPGAEWLVAFDSRLAIDVFLALLIEVPDPHRDRPDLMDHGFHYDCWHFVRPPFWDFPPAEALFSQSPDAGVDFVLRLADFATDRWAERWPNVARARSSYDEVPTDVPKIRLTVDGIERDYVGDARVLDWHQGGSQGPDAAAAALMSLEHWLYEQDEKNELKDDILRRIFVGTHSVAVIGVLLELALKSPSYLLGALEPLVQCADIYHWCLLNIDPTKVRTAMIAWGDPWGRIPQERIQSAYAWHSMEHRQRHLLAWVTYVWVRQRFEWAAVNSARGDWTNLCDRHPSARMREWIREVLLCNLDPANWHIATQADGSEAAEYNHPEDIDKKQTEVRRSIEEGVVRRHLPLRCRLILDGRNSADEATIVELLKTAAAPLDQWSEEETWLMGGPWTPRCGVAAVAILKFDSWLNSNPEWRTLCHEWLVEAPCASPPELRESPSLGDSSWDCFAAEALPSLWLQEPKNKDMRRAIARLVAAPTVEARKRLFMTIARERSRCADDFARLLHLAVWVARLKMLDPGPLPEHYAANFDRAGLQKAFARLVKDFVNGRLEPLPPDWPEIADARPKGFRSSSYGEYDGLEDHSLVQSLSWLSAVAPDYQKTHDRDLIRVLIQGLASLVPHRLSKSYDEEEEQRRRWASFKPESLLRRVDLDALSQSGELRQSAKPQSRLQTFATKIRKMTYGGLEVVRKVIPHQAAGRLPASTSPPRRRPIGSPHHGADIDIATLVAMFLVREPDANARRKLWEPWLDVGDRFHDWVEVLLDKTYSAALAVDEKESQFGALMREVFEHSLAPGGWLNRDGRHSHRISDVGVSFLGFGQWNHTEFWSADRAPTAIALRDYWPRWADTAISWHGCAAAFARLLRQPAMASLRPESLHWLVRSEPARWMSDQRACEKLLLLLQVIWSERHERELAGSTREVFERLLHELVSHQVPDALALSGQVARDGD